MSKLYNSVIKAKNAYVSGFVDLDVDSISESNLKNVAYRAYLEQIRARWGGVNATTISKKSLKDLENEVYEFEKDYLKSKLVSGGKLRREDAILNVFMNEY